MADWLSSTRSGKLAMAQNWCAVLGEDIPAAAGRLVKKYTAWGVPGETFTRLAKDFDTARSAFQTAQSDELRTKPVTEACRVAFDALEKTMRFVKDHYFKTPPLTSVDLTTLGLKPHDKKPTVHGAPTGLPAAALANPHPGVITLSIGAYNKASAADEAAERVCIRWGVMPHGGASVEEAAGPRRYLMKVPVSANELPELRTTRRKKEQVQFPPEDKGKRAFFCLRYENNKGDAGPWSPIIEGVIT